MAIEEKWINVIGAGRAGREIVNTLCRTKSVRKTCAEFFYIDKARELENLCEEKIFVKNIYTLEEFREKGIPAVFGLEEGLTILIAGAGGFKTGVKSIIDIASKIKIPTIAIVSFPFKWEGKQMRYKAIEAVNQLRDVVDILIAVDYNYIPTINEKGTIRQAFKKGDELVASVIKAFVYPFSLKYQLMSCLCYLDIISIFSKDKYFLPAEIVCVGIGKSNKNLIEALESAMDNPLCNVDLRKADHYFIVLGVDANASSDEFLNASDHIEDKYIPEYGALMQGAYINDEKGYECVVFGSYRNLSEVLGSA